MSCLRVVTALLMVSFTTALYENCDYYQELKPGVSYYVYSPGYPNRYSPGSSCRWYAVSPPNTQVFLVCEKVSIPASQNCMYDKLLISRSGSEHFQDGEPYCGTGSFTAVSNNNMMSIALHTSYNSPGGSFLCNIGVQELPPGTEPPQEDCECGWRNKNRIVGGTQTGVNEYPMMAGLVHGTRRELFCGATIISRRFCLTAAHCLVNQQPFEIGVLVGDHDISTGSDTDSAKLYIIDLFISYPNYDTVSQKNDIAIVRTRDPIAFSSRVGPACLPFSAVGYSLTGQPVLALGWGTTEFTGATSDVLLSAVLNVTSPQRCEATYGSTFVASDQICTYTEGKDGCQADSGGPLLWSRPGSGGIFIAGIISYGLRCATENPSVNTRVTSYLSWIQQSTGERFCVK